MVKKLSEPKKKEEKESTIDLKKAKKELDKFLEEKKDELLNSIAVKVDEQIDLKVTKRMKEDEKKFVRGKNGKIIRRDIIILLLLAVVGYFGYCLYQVDYFNIRTKPVNEVKEPITKEDDKPEDKEEEPKAPEFDSAYYIKQYRYLVDNLQIDDKAVFDLYKDKVDSENLSNDLLLKIAYKNLAKEKVVSNNGMLSFKSLDLLESAQKIFGNKVVLDNEIFTYNAIRFMYYDDTYLGFSEDNKAVGLLYDIESAKMEDDKLIFEVVVSKLNEEKLLNINDEIVLESYNNEELLNYKDKLNTYQFVFQKNGDDFIFSKIEKN